MMEKTSSRRFKRKLSPFLAHQMLYDYATDQLDDERRTAIEEFLDGDQEGRAILASLKQALAYSDRLGKTKIDRDLLEHLKDAESPVSLGKRFSSWREWPEPFRWSVTAIAISCLVAGFVALVPWDFLGVLLTPKKKSNVVEVAQIPTSGEQDLEAAEEPVGSGDAPPEEESSGDEEIGDEAGDTAVAAGHEAPPQALVQQAETPMPIVPKLPPRVGWHPPMVLPASMQAAMPPPQPVTPPQQPQLPTQSQTQTQAQAAAQVAAEEAQPAPTGERAKGFVYRAFMTIENIDVVTPQITDAVRGLGGEKAGEVELGWKRGEGRYYHFSLPEENEKKLMDKLQAYGPVRISKDPHPRIMPAGRVRFILWVESAR